MKVFIVLLIFLTFESVFFADAYESITEHIVKFIKPPQITIYSNVNPYLLKKKNESKA